MPSDSSDHGMKNWKRFRRFRFASLMASMSPKSKKHDRTLLFCSVFFFVLFATMRGQDWNFDLLNYHYYLGYQLVNWRYAIDITPASHMAAFANPLPSVIVYFLLTYLPPALSTAALTLLHCLVLIPLLGIFHLLKAELKPDVTKFGYILGFVLTLVGPMWLTELGSTFSEILILPVCITSVYLTLGLVARDQRSQSIQHFWLGFCIVLPVFLKMTFVMLSAPIGLIALSLVMRNALEKDYRPIILLLLGGLLAIAICGGWNLYLALRWGNPIFPFFNGIFQSPYFDDYNWRDNRWGFNTGLDVIGYIFGSVQPTTTTLELPFADARYAIVFLLLLPLGLVAKFGTYKTSFVLLFIVISSFSIWTILFGYQRYLLPVEILLGITIWVLVEIIVRVSGFRYAILGGALLLTVYALKVPDFGHGEGGENQAGYFSNNMPAEVKDADAIYIMAGNQVSFLAPFLGGDNYFFGFDILSREKINQEIWSRLTELEGKPIYLVALRDEVNGRWELMRQATGSSLDMVTCIDFQSASNVYSICALANTERLDDVVGAYPLEYGAEPVVTNWGSQSFLVGEGMNIQPDGSSAIWIHARNFTGRGMLFLQFGPYRVNKAASVTFNGLTSEVPANVVNTAGDYEIKITDEQGNVYPVGTLSVRPEE